MASAYGIPAIYVVLVATTILAETIDLDDAIIQKLLKKVPEIPAIPTKNGYYIFVPSLPHNALSQQTYQSNTMTPSSQGNQGTQEVGGSKFSSSYVVLNNTASLTNVGNSNSPSGATSFVTSSQGSDNTHHSEETTTSSSSWISTSGTTSKIGMENSFSTGTSVPGNEISGRMRLRGINRSGAEYSCVKNLGIFEGPVDDDAIKNMKKWNINVVRIPLNEDCWLGINGHTAAYIGENYKKAVIDYVNLLRKNGLSVILDLHWTGGLYQGNGQGECVDKAAKCQKPMPDKEYAPKFWQSVAKQFKNDNGIIFDLFNEPFPDMVMNDKTAAWECWKNGGKSCSGFQYEVAGMQDLVNAVRDTGAKNLVMVGGITWSNDLSQWMKFVPKDEANNIAASWHSYNFNSCNDKNCWESQVAPVAAKYPVIAGEIGEHGCTHTYIDGLLDWLDEKKISYVGWTWNTWDCSSGPSLIIDYSGTPTEFGKGLKDHLARNVEFGGNPSLSGGSGASNGDNKVSNNLSNTAVTVGSTSNGASSFNVINDGTTSSISGSVVGKGGKQLRGINRSGAEYSCVKNLGIFEGPVDDDAIKNMKKWNINVVRIPLNEDCWLGINGHTAAYIGENYKKAVIDYVNLLRKNGLSVILDLHWTGGLYQGNGQGECVDKAAKCQKPMPDKEYAPKFWQSVAKQFKNDNGIIFDLFNEPFPDMVMNDKTAAWECWKNGGKSCSGFQYEVAGMQDLVNAVRDTGAKNLVMVGGITWSNDLSQWMKFVPKDEANNIAASWHSYNFNSCNDKNCWESQVAPVAAKYPVIAGEIGEHGCTHTYIDGLLDWLDEKKISYVGWTWNTWDCSSGPSLIIDYSGTPTEFGKGLKDHLARNVEFGGNPSLSGGSGASNGDNKVSNNLSNTAVTVGSTSNGASSFNVINDGTTSSISGSVVGKGGKQLRGINRSGAEYSCVKNLGIFEGPVDDDAIKNMKKWNINVVRIPLNEDCWLGINGHTAAYIGENYKKAVIDYVNLLRKNGLSVILDLHWTGGLYQGNGQGECVDKAAKCQKPMPDKEYAPKFWQSVAKQFKNDNGIIFDLFNEPFPDMVMNDKTAAWECWKNGGKSCSGFQYEVAGMQDLVNAVRDTGAKNLVMVGGITWSNDLSQWMKFVPKDEANNIAASWHSYNFNSCNDKNCWESQVAPVAAKYPVIAGEIGEHGCTHTYIDGLLDWLDEKKISYVGWTWNTWDCSSGPSLIIDYSGTPTEFGKGLKDHLARNVEFGGNPSLSGGSGASNGDSKVSNNLSNTAVTVGSTSNGATSFNVINDGTTSSISGSVVGKGGKQLRGINRSGAEYSCVKNLGIFEGPVDDDAIKNMKKWNINVVRIPLNEDCWLGINGHTAAYIGENYKKAVIDYVNLLRKNGLSVILDLHWTGGLYQGNGQGECVDKAAKCQKPMPDKEYAPKFWQSVAKQFKNDNGIIFDLFNEPFPDMVMNDKTAAWECWKNGGKSCSGFQYEVAGMQDLVNAVRDTGAKNLVMVGGITWSNDLSQWMKFVPKDEANNIAASWHSYNFNSCNDKNCWESQVAPVAAKYPVIAGEIGEHGCTHTYIDGLLDWLDEKKISYVGWTWNTWDCSSGPSLIIDYSGTPTEFGKGLKDHLFHVTNTDNKNSIEESSDGKNSNAVHEQISNAGSVNTGGSGQTSIGKQLRGVNRSGAEYSCVKNLGIFEGPVDDNSIKNMKKWNINVVRIPLNEDCWLGINDHTVSYIGEKYKTAVKDYVKLLRKNDLSVILDLHWSGGLYNGAGKGECVDKKAKCQKPMPDAENAPSFWKSVAKEFKGDDNIIFDLFNEPFPDMIYWDKTAVWKCWRDGGSACPDFPYPAAGMQDLVNAVREVGATNPVMVGGINWSSDLTQWKKYIPTDPLNKIVASWHAYALNPCNNTNCWETMIGPIAKEYPVIVGEMGETDCTHEYIDKLMEWLDKKGISYVGWTWNTWDCQAGPALITKYDGTPTNFGKGLLTHLTSDSNRQEKSNSSTPV